MSSTVKPARVTLSDVAKRAGVSTMTVSRVVNGDRRVTAATRERVKLAITDLNYAPNVAARTLAGGKVHRICLLYGNPSSAYLGDLLYGALKAASDVGANLIVERVAPDFQPTTLLNHFGEDWDAIIIPPPMSDLPEIRSMIADKGFPAAFLSSAQQSAGAQDFRIDDERASYDATKHILKEGHRRIGFIKGHPNQSVSRARFSGYARALGDAGLSLEPALIEDGLFTYRSGEQAATRILHLTDPPTAIFASNDDMAAGALAAAARAGITVPDDLSVVGFDDSSIASTVWPPLTTMRQPVSHMADLAVRALTSNDPPNPSGVTTVPHSFIRRISLGRLPTRKT